MMKSSRVRVYFHDIWYGEAHARVCHQRGGAAKRLELHAQKHYDSAVLIIVWDLYGARYIVPDMQIRRRYCT
eukprot:854227-Prymnesium_polylepis.2